MTITAPRRPLPMAGRSRANRSAATCHFTCGDACLKDEGSTSTSPSFAAVAQASVSRRTMLSGLGATVLWRAPPPRSRAPPPRRQRAAPLGRAPSPPEPVVPGAPAFDLDHQSAEAQEKQLGDNCDYLALLPGYRGTALLVANHEHTDENLMVPGPTDEGALTVEQLRTSIAAHGMSIVAVRRSGGRGPWEVAPSPWGRRITALSTEFSVTGPVTGSDLLKTSADPTGTRVIGTLNNCAGGAAGEGRCWWKVDRRFDVAAEPNEINRFGWVVEVDPYDPASTPRQHTALGRFTHEGATKSPTKDGRLAVYMGDDTADQHLYKFVSASKPASCPSRASPPRATPPRPPTARAGGSR